MDRSIVKNKDALLTAFSAKEDMNKAGLQRGKKTVVSKAATAHAKPAFQQEDVFHAEFPFDGDSKKALFCIFDGHAGNEAALAAKEHMPKVLGSHLKEKEKSGKTPTDLSEILPITFLQVDEKMSANEYEGCTATAVVIWQAGSDRYVQAANVGDSRAYLCREDKVVCMSKDHKLSDEEEKARLANIGVSVNDGQTRLNGLAVTRALGDRFAKEANCGMIAVPYVSEPIKLDPSDKYMIVASDGLWDVVTGQKACEICDSCPEPTPEAMATALLTTACQSPKCQDNVSVIVVVL
jgi:protein phosphatase